MLACFGLLPHAKAAEENLDITFGSGGKVSTDFFGSVDSGHATAIDSSGRIVVAGSAFNPSPAVNGYQFAVARYSPSGALDGTFGFGGKSTTDFPGGPDEAYAVAMDGNQRILAAGRWYNSASGNYDFALARFTSAGVPDPAFGSGGRVTTDISGSTDEAYAVAIDGNQRILVAGRCFNPSTGNYDFALVRYTAQGVLDSTFGTGGKVRTDFSGGSDQAYAIALDTSGRIILAGSNGAMALARYSSGGVLDPTFGSGGKVTSTFFGFGASANAVVIGPGDSILAAGRALTSTVFNSHCFALARFTSTGAPDSAFGTGGTVTTVFDGKFSRANAVVRLANGNIVAAGGTSTPNGGSGDFALARYSATGALDSTFGIGGKTTTNAGYASVAAAAVVDANGDVIAAGRTYKGSANGFDFALVRYASAGAPRLAVKFGTVTRSSGHIHNFGTTSLTDTKNVSITITNTGNAPLTGIAASIIPAGSADFQVGTPAPPSTLAAGASATFGVSFTPQAVGSRTATLRLANNSLPNPYVVDFVGVGRDSMIVEGSIAYNGHTYYLLDKASWSASQAEAVAMGGNLVTVNDAAEWTFITQKFFNTSYADVNGFYIWLGLHDPDNDGTYTWVSGEPATFRIGEIISTPGQFGTAYNDAGFQPPPPNPGPSYPIDWTFVAANLPWTTAANADQNYGVVEIDPTQVPAIAVSVDGEGIASGGDSTFENTNPGQSTAATITISNPGLAALQNISASITEAEGAAFTLVSLPPATVAAGGFANFQISFNPQTIGTREATLNILSNASQSPYLIQLSGSGVDTIPPVVTVQATALNVVCDDPANIPTIEAWLASAGGASATDNSGTILWSNDYSVLPPPCGNALITFTAEDPAGNVATTTAHLTSIDITPPVIVTTASDTTVESDGAGNVAERNAWLDSHGGASATDTCGNVTWSHNFTGLANNLPQTVIVTFSATDSCGNSSTTEASFTIQDTTPPNLTVPAAPFFGDCDSGESQIVTFLNNRGGAQAVDIAGPVTWSNDYNGTPPDCEGYITVTFTATDAGGLSVSTSARFFLFPEGAIWIGPETGSWTTASGWRSQVPTQLLDAYVDLFDFQNTTLTMPGGTHSAKNLHIGPGDLLGVGGTFELYGDTIRNAGQIRMEASQLLINGPTSLTGEGQVILTGNGINRIGRGANSILDVLTVSSGQKITTTEDTVADYQRTSIHAGLINHGTLTANTGGLVLYQDPKTNRGIFRAINGGQLRIQSPVDNVDGTLFADVGSSLWLQDTLTGGTVTGTGRLLMNTTAGLTGPLLLDAGLTTTAEGGVTDLIGTIVNDGEILISVPAGGSAAVVAVDGAATLEGSGKVILQGQGNRRIMRANSSAADILTVGPAQEITATDGTIAEYQNGAIHAGLINHGTITADGSGLTLYSNSKTNHGLFRAINGGLLRMETPVANSAGTLFAGEGSTLKLEDTLTGGIVTGTGRLLMNSIAGLSGPITLDGGLTVAVEGSTTALKGSIALNGQLLLGSATGATLDIDGAVSLSGTGTIILQGGNLTRLIERGNSSASDVLTLLAGQEITTTAGTVASSQRAGIKAGLINHGIISADEGGLALTHNSKTNHGTFRATRGGSLLIASSILTNYDPTTDTLTGGRWEVRSEGTPTLMDILSSPIITIAPDTFVCLSGENASLPQLSGLSTIAGTLCLENGKTFTTVGNLSVPGTLNFGLGDGALHGFDSQRLVINGSADFTGAKINVLSLGTTPGLYEIIRWTGTSTGIPVLSSIPSGGLNYRLIFDPIAKTVSIGVADDLPSIIAIRHDPLTGATTIDYQSVLDTIHQVRGTENFINFDALPDTAIGSGTVMQYIHPSATPPDRYFYQFSTSP